MGRIRIRKYRGTETQRACYTNSVSKVLDIMRQSQTGRILLKHIRLTNYPVLIYTFLRPTSNASANGPTWWNSGITDVVHNYLASFGTTVTTKPILAHISNKGFRS